MDEVPIPKSTSKVVSDKKKQKRNRPAKDINNMDEFDKILSNNFCSIVYYYYSNFNCNL